MDNLLTYELDEKIICTAMLAFNCQVVVYELKILSGTEYCNKKILLLFQGVVKFFCILTNSKSIKDISDFCSEIYKANTKSSPNKALLAKSVITVFKF